MRRITGLLSSSSEIQLFAADAYLEQLSRLIGFRPDPRADTATLEWALLALREARRHGYQLLSRAGCLALHLEDCLVDRLRAAALMLRRWIGELERAAREAPTVDPGRGALLYELMAGGADLAWQIERDALGGREAVRQLLGAPEPGVESLSRAWQLSVLLNALGRLEVRGRDAAGLAIQARFPDRAAATRVLAAGGARGCDQQPPSRRHQRIVLRPEDCDQTLLLLHGVGGGDGVGSGSSVRTLRDRLVRDPLLQAALREPGATIQALSHVGWDAHGIGVIGCRQAEAPPLALGHGVAETGGSLVAVVAGEPENRTELLRRHAPELDPQTTSSAAIVPVVVDRCRRGRPLEEAFRVALDELEGSLAIALMAAERPGELFLGRKGSAQDLFVGFAGDTLAVASELRGVVELTQDYLRLEGEQTPGGEMLVLKAGDDRVDIRRRERGGEGTVPPDRRKRAGITTRDVDRIDELRSRPGDSAGTPSTATGSGQDAMEASADRVRQLVL